MEARCFVCGGLMRLASGRDWVCSECGAEAWRGDDGTFIFDADFFADDEDNSTPTGCIACGGDYPLCKDSCPLFDD